MHKTAYSRSKQLLPTDKVLEHYEEKKSLALVCNASPYGIGALLFHMELLGETHLFCFQNNDLHRMNMPRLTRRLSKR